MSMNYFSINGVKSTDRGIIMKTPPAIPLAAPRVTYQDIPGRDGSLAILERDEEDGPVYDDISMNAECYMASLDRLNEAAAFLEQSGEIRFPHRPGGHYKGRITNQIPIEQIVKGRPQRQFAVTFRCGPYWYQDDAEDIVLTQNGIVTNPGTARAEPLITVTGSGDGTLAMHGAAVYIRGLSGTLTLDCELKLAYSGTELKNGLVSVDVRWPYLAPGDNAVAISGDISQIVITPRWRYR